MNGSAQVRRRRVLSIDGGGVRGLLSARVMSYVESRLRKHGVLHPRGLACNFDMMAGTSSGAMLVMGLASGKSAAEVEGAFRAHVPRIFSVSWLGRVFNPFLTSCGATYGAQGLERVLVDFLDDKALGQLGADHLPDERMAQAGARPLLMLTAYDIQQSTTRFFKSWKPGHAQLLARDLVMGSSAAPSYFPPKIMFIPPADEGDPPGPATLLDGALFANNPAMSAWAEARKIWPRDDICILSIGTGQHEEPYDPLAAARRCRESLIRQTFKAMLDGQSDAVHYQLQSLYAPSASVSGGHWHPPGYLRLQAQLLQASSQALDDVSEAHLEGLVVDADRLVSDESAAIEYFVGHAWP